jgi:hypothetical protein
MTTAVLLEQFLGLQSKERNSLKFLSDEMISHFEIFYSNVKNSFFHKEDTIYMATVASDKFNSYLVAVDSSSTNDSIVDTSLTTFISPFSSSTSSNADGQHIEVDWNQIISITLSSFENNDPIIISDNTDLLDLGSIHSLSILLFCECDAQRYAHCIILCSAIESLLVRFTSRGNERQILRQILQSLSVQGKFPKTLEQVLEAIFLPTGFNIRNLLWHGFLTDGKYFSSMLFLLINLFEKLRFLFKEENSVSDGLLSPARIDGDITHEWKLKLQMVYNRLWPMADSSGDDSRLLYSLWNQRKVTSLVRKCCLLDESMRAIIESALSDYFSAVNNTESAPSSTAMVLSMLKILPTLEHMLRILFSVVNPRCSMYSIASKGEYFTTLDGFGQRMKHQLLLSPSLLHATTASKTASPSRHDGKMAFSATTSYSSSTSGLVNERDYNNYNRSSSNNNLPSTLGSGLYALLVDLFMTDDGLNARAKLAHGYQLFHRFLDYDGPVTEALLSLEPMFDTYTCCEYQMLCEVLILVIVKLCLQFPEHGYNCRQLSLYVEGIDTYSEGSLRADDAESIISAIESSAVVEAEAELGLGTLAVTDITADEVRELRMLTCAALSSYESAFHPMVRMKRAMETTIASFHTYASFMTSYRLLKVESQSSDVATVAVEYFDSGINGNNWVRFTDKVDKLMEYIPPNYCNEKQKTGTENSLWNLSQRIVTRCLQYCIVLQTCATLPLCESMYASIADRVTSCCGYLQIENGQANTFSPLPPPPQEKKKNKEKELLLEVDENIILLHRITEDILSLYAKRPVLKVPCLLQLLEVSSAHVLQ